LIYVIPHLRVTAVVGTKEQRKKRVFFVLGRSESNYFPTHPLYLPPKTLAHAFLAPSSRKTRCNRHPLPTDVACYITHVPRLPFVTRIPTVRFSLRLRCGKSKCGT
ncbi:unnamed protein product, partial [Ectocarpus fasciculatus]